MSGETTISYEKIWFIQLKLVVWGSRNLCRTIAAESARNNVTKTERHPGPVTVYEMSRPEHQASLSGGWWNGVSDTKKQRCAISGMQNRNQNEAFGDLEGMSMYESWIYFLFAVAQET